MRKIILTLVTAVALVFGAKADVITVSNNVDSPGQYTNLQDAIDDSDPFDTILIAGSSVDYGNIELFWPLTIIGAGVDNAYGENTNINSISIKRATSALSGSGTEIIGVICNVSISGNYNGNVDEISDITINRCILNSLDLGNVSTIYNNINIHNNIILGSCTFGRDGSNLTYLDNINIFNNIFSSNYIIRTYHGNSTSKVLSGVKFRNNLFFKPYSYYSSMFYYTTGPTSQPGYVMENNIFYNANPVGCSNCSFNNNLTFMNTNDELIHTDNPGSVGANNLIGQDPKFVSLPLTSTAFDWFHDYHLKPSSPGIDAGTDGTDIGIYGGSLPFEQIGKNPNIPQMEWISFPGNSSAPVGGSLNVDFKSHRQD